MKKVLLTKVLLLAAVLFTGVSFAQTVTGTVSEANGPLPGASVVVKGTSNGASTDFDGNYTLNNVPNDAILVFSYVGYSTQEVAVNGQSSINLTLSSDNALDEVVLIGYGSTTIKDATGSVAAVSSEDFVRGVISSPEQLIQGKTAGVQITETSGSPGAGINIRIRGSNSVRGGNDPLFVVDGIPLAAGGTNAPSGLGVGGGDARNPLSFLNPNDIESISILKDASATAIYGARAANGVVIIKTKTGRGNASGSFELGSSISSSWSRTTYDLLDRRGFLNAIEFFGGDRNAADFGGNNDFQDEILRNSFSRQTDLTYSKSFDTGSIRVGGSYSNQLGIVENSGQERITARLNGVKKFFDDKLTIDFQGSIARVNDEAPPLAATAGFNGDLLGSALIANPTWPVDPNFNPGGGALNPINLLNNYEALSNTNRILANIAATYNFTDNLSARVALGYDDSDSQTTTIYSALANGFQAITGNGQGTIQNFQSINKLLDATLNYNKQFDNWSIDALAGFSYQQFRRNGVFGTGFGFTTTDTGLMRDDLFEALDAINGATTANEQVYGFGPNDSFAQSLGADGTVVDRDVTDSFARSVSAFVADEFGNTDEIQSFFLRTNFTFKDKYLLTATVRADGSSVFGPNNTYGVFPSAAIAWKLHEEDFVGDNISTLKLRVGAGSVGNQQGIGFANFLLRQGIAGPGITPEGEVLRGGSTTFGSFNPELKWESTVDLNIGVDFGFNNDRFNGSFNLFNKTTNDLLFSRITGVPGNGAQVFENLSDFEIVNQGVELSINYDFVDTEDWGFSTSFNIAYIDNNVQGAPGAIDTGAVRGQGLTGAFAQRLDSGQPLFSWFLPIFEGFDDDGFPIYQDIDGDGIGDPSLDKTFVGEDAQPDITSGLSLNARYKRFDLGVFFNGQFGFSVYNATANAFFTAGNPTSGRNTIASVLTSGEAAGSSADVSTRFLEKGDFVRLQNLSIGYNWPVSNEGFFDSLRLNASAQNLFLITGYSGLDPEITSNTGDLGSGVPTLGIDYSSFPRPTTVTLGINAKF